MNAANPLLAFARPQSPHVLPQFETIAPEHVQPALSGLLADARSLQERLTAATVPATWDDFAGPLADGIETLSRAWGIVGHLHSVNDTPPWREAYNALLPEVTRFYTELGQDLKLFDKYRALRAGPEYAGLSPARRRIVDTELQIAVRLAHCAVELLDCFLQLLGGRWFGDRLNGGLGHVDGGTATDAGSRHRHRRLRRLGTSQGVVPLVSFLEHP